MYLKFAAAALLLAPLYAQTPVAPQSETSQALPDARTIIDRHIKAVGGREAILSHKSMHGTGTFTVAGSGMSGSVDMYGAAAPDRVTLKVSIPGLGEIVEGFDGTHGWSVSPMTGPMLKSGKELEQTKLDADFFSELRDPKLYPTVTTVEKTDFDGRPCYKVSLKRVDGTNDFDFYDVATGLRAGSTNTRETSMGTVTSTSVERDYKKFGSMLQATTVVEKTMGVEQQITLTSVEYDKVDPSAFEPPAAIKALIK
jgi:hypothetical protein